MSKTENRMANFLGWLWAPSLVWRLKIKPVYSPVFQGLAADSKGGREIIINKKRLWGRFELLAFLSTSYGMSSSKNNLQTFILLSIPVTQRHLVNVCRFSAK
jgi:hypothetical protein